MSASPTPPVAGGVADCRHCAVPVVYSAFHMQWLGPDGTAWCATGGDHDGSRTPRTTERARGRRSV